MIDSDKKLESLKYQLNKWRAKKNGQMRIPENMWAIAVELAKQYGISPVASRLSLNHTYLKSRCLNEGKTKEQNSAQQSPFIQIQHFPGSNPIRIEVCKIDGSQMRLECPIGYALEAKSAISAFIGE